MGKERKQQAGRKEGKEKGSKLIFFTLGFHYCPAKFLKTFMVSPGTWTTTRIGDVVIKTVISNHKCRACEMRLFLCKRIPEMGASQKLYLHTTVPMAATAKQLRLLSIFPSV